MANKSDIPISAYVNGIGLIGPGLPSWQDSISVLAGESAYLTEPTLFPVPILLPPAERRRSGKLVRLTLAVGLEATLAAGEEPASLACIYTSSSGDGINCHEICKTLASEDRQISPTRFHNSVHNAAAGYWSIATGAKTPISVLCAHDASFSAGLLEAVSQVVSDNISTILIAGDTGYPEPLNHARPIPDVFGISLVLSPNISKHAMAKIQIHLTTNTPANQMTPPGLEALRTQIPAARGLPLLSAIARRQTTTVALDYLDHMRLTVDVTPC